LTLDYIFEENNRTLGPIRKQNLIKLMEFRNQQMDILRQSRPLTEEDQKKWFEKISKDDSQVMFEILLKEKNQEKFIGVCGLTYIDYLHRRAELSFIDDPIRAKDKETYKDDFLAIIKMLCSYGFEKLNLNKIFTETYEFRDYHIKVLESFGFKFEGKLREHVFINDRFYDSLFHSILHSEWKIRNSKL